MEKQESEYNIFDWWKKCVFKNYANFTGRARRKEFWYFILFNIILIVPAYVLLLVISENADATFPGVVGIMFALLVFGLLIPYLAVIVRRLHDQNKSGWNYFFGFIPIVGPIMLLVWYCTEGDRFMNKYGHDSKEEGVLDFDFDKNPS